MTTLDLALSDLVKDLTALALAETDTYLGLHGRTVARDTLLWLATQGLIQRAEVPAPRYGGKEINHLL